MLVGVGPSNTAHHVLASGSGEKQRFSPYTPLNGWLGVLIGLFGRWNGSRRVQVYKSEAGIRGKDLIGRGEGI